MKTLIRFQVYTISLLMCIGCTQKDENIAQRGMNATVALMLYDESNNPKSLGSGFFISENKVVTNYHVIEGAKTGYIKSGQGDELDEIFGVLSYDEEKDLALLMVKANNQNYLEVGNSDRLIVGEDIFVIGAPSGLQGTFSNGIISAIRSIENQSYIQITAPISAGSSGGPVLNKSGVVIGVAVGTIIDGQNLNFAVPSNELSELIQAESTFITLGDLTRKKKESEPIASVSVDSGTHQNLSLVVDRYINANNYDAALELLYNRNTNNVLIKSLLEKTHLNYGLHSMSTFVPGEMRARMNFALVQFTAVLKINQNNSIAREQIEQIMAIYSTYSTISNRQPEPEVLEGLREVGFDY